MEHKRSYFYLREDLFINFVQKNVTGTFLWGGIGVLLLDVSEDENYRFSLAKN